MSTAPFDPNEPQPEPMPSGEAGAAPAPAGNPNRNKLVIGGIALGAVVVAGGGFLLVNSLGGSDTTDDTALPKPKAKPSAAAPTVAPTGAPNGVPGGQPESAPDPDATPLPTLTALSGRNPFLAPIVASTAGSTAAPSSASNPVVGGKGRNSNSGSTSGSTSSGTTTSGTTNTGTTSSGSSTSGGTVSQAELDRSNAIAAKAVSDLADAQQKLEQSQAAQRRLQESMAALQKQERDGAGDKAKLAELESPLADGKEIVVPDKSEVTFLGLVPEDNGFGCIVSAKEPTYLVDVKNTKINTTGPTSSQRFCVGAGMTFVNPGHYQHLPAHVLVLKKVEGEGADMTATIGFFDKTYSLKKDASQVLFDTTNGVASAKTASSRQ